MKQLQGIESVFLLPLCNKTFSPSSSWIFRKNFISGSDGGSGEWSGTIDSIAGASDAAGLTLRGSESGSFGSGSNDDIRFIISFLIFALRMGVVLFSFYRVLVVEG